jgi:hypothetical protein
MSFLYFAFLKPATHRDANGTATPNSRLPTFRYRSPSLFPLQIYFRTVSGPLILLRFSYGFLMVLRRFSYVWLTFLLLRAYTEVEKSKRNGKEQLEMGSAE